MWSSQNVPRLARNASHLPARFDDVPIGRASGSGVPTLRIRMGRHTERRGIVNPLRIMTVVGFAGLILFLLQGLVVHV